MAAWPVSALVAQTLARKIQRFRNFRLTGSFPTKKPDTFIFRLKHLEKWEMWHSAELAALAVLYVNKRKWNIKLVPARVYICERVLAHLHSRLWKELSLSLLGKDGT